MRDEIQVRTASADRKRARRRGMAVFAVLIGVALILVGPFILALWKWAVSL